MIYSKLIQNLIEEFSKFPNIGPRAAERFVFYLLEKSPQYLENISSEIKNLKKINKCPICGNITENKICSICQNPKRNHRVICVVADIPDLMAIERVGQYNGVYHVLNGLINNIKNVGPSKLRIKSLLDRIEHKEKGFIEEIILALNSDINGETTALYLKKILAPYKIKLTRLARGLPMGSDLVYADEITLAHALKNRKQINKK